MKYHIQALCLLLTFSLLSSSLFSNGLPIYRAYAPVKLVIDDKKPKFYKKQMKDLQEAGKYEGALCYAFLLREHGKRKQTKIADKFLAEHFENNLKMVAESIDSLNKQTEVFNDELSAQAASRLWCHYKDMVSLKQLVDKYGGAYKVPVDYTDQATKTEQVKTDYFKKTAQMYFDEVVAVEPAAASKADYKPLARKLRRALKYENRRDILDLYGKVKKLATTTFGVGKATDRVTNSAVVIGEIRGVLYSEIKNSISRSSIPFLELMPNDKSMTSDGADLVVEIVVENRNIQTSKDTPTTEDLEKTKKVGEGEAERVETYKAKYTTYGKKANVTLQGVYIIKERTTGKTIRSDNITGTYTWSDYWYSYSGNIKALSKSQKRKVEQKESPYPPDGELINSAATGLAQQAGIQVLKYLRKTFK